MQPGVKPAQVCVCVYACVCVHVRVCVAACVCRRQIVSNMSNLREIEKPEPRAESRKRVLRCH